MLKKYISVFLVIMAFIVVLTACSKTENPETTTSPETEESQIIIDEDITEESSENTSDEDVKPSANQNDSGNTTKPSGNQSTTKPSADKPSNTKPNTTKPNTTKPITTKPNTTNKNEPVTCRTCGGVITSNNGDLTIGKYCDGRCDEWNEF